MHRYRIRAFFSITASSIILLLLCGCNLPLDFTLAGYGGELKRVVTIDQVSVAPQAGTGTFTLTLSYSRGAEHEGSVTISCYYLTPDRNTYGILALDDDGKRANVTQTREFTVIQADGKPATGVYTATCSDENGMSEKSATFVVEEDPSSEVSILSLGVKGGNNGQYRLELLYLLKITNEVGFTCNYTSPDGATMLIGNFTDSDILQQPKTKTLYFSVSPADLKNNLGLQVYTATCQDDEGRSTKSAAFSVEGNPVATESPMPSATAATGPVYGKFVFDTVGVKTTPPGLGALVNDVIRNCIPDVTIDPAGSISGVCNYSGATDLYTFVNITVEVSGTAVREGAIEFNYRVKEFAPNGWKLGTVSDVRIWAEEWYFEVDITGTGVLSASGEGSGLGDLSHS